MKNKKLVFVCSRYAGDTEHNLEIARKLCRRVLEEGEIPFAPHLFFTQFLRDFVPEERQAGIDGGHFFMELCDEVLVYTGDGISKGMEQDIAAAEKLGKIVNDISEEESI